VLVSGLVGAKGTDPSQFGRPDQQVCGSTNTPQRDQTRRRAKRGAGSVAFLDRAESAITADGG